MPPDSPPLAIPRASTSLETLDSDHPFPPPPPSPPTSVRKMGKMKQGVEGVVVIEGPVLEGGGLTATTLTPTRTTSFNSLASSQRPILNPSTTTTATNPTTTSTTNPWKRNPKSKQQGTISVERKRLAALGFEEELDRNFDFWASWGMGVCNIGFLPGTMLGALTALSTGGGLMYTIMWPLSGLFMCGLAAVLGEMGSTWPVAGAMFTWTFRLCRSSRRLDSWARFISWIVGSFLLCSHILIQIIISYQLSRLLQGIICLHNANFQVTFWKSMGIGWAVLVFTGAIVSSAITRSPLLWRIAGGAIVLSFVTINIVLLVHAEEIRPAKFVFLSFGNTTGWASKSYVFIIGWALTCIASGMEACSHMAEDTKSPARTVPLAMFWSTATSYILGWISICIFLATADTRNMNPRLQQPVAVLASTLTLPWATLLSILVLLSLVAQNVAQLLATSRFIWSLARESALPFSNLFKYISKRQRQPLPAIWVVILIAAPSLLLLGISVSIVTTMFLEAAAWTNMFAYFVPVGIYLGGCGEDALSGDGRVQWTLRKWSKPVGWGVATFAIMFLIVTCLPTGYPVTDLTASYASGVAVGILLLSSLSWVFYGNARYAGPIKTSTRWTLGAEVELPPSTSFKTTTAPAAGDTTSAAHGRSAHVFSSFPTLTSNGDNARTEFSEETGFSETGYTTGGDYESNGEESRISPSSSLGDAEYWRQRRRAENLEDGIRGRERSVTRS